MAVASETSGRITKFYMKWTKFLVHKCAKVKTLVEINVYFEVDGTFRYFLSLFETVLRNLNMLNGGI